jgi:hypothetical protein
VGRDDPVKMHLAPLGSSHMLLKPNQETQMVSGLEAWGDCSFLLGQH